MRMSNRYVNYPRLDNEINTNYLSRSNRRILQAYGRLNEYIFDEF